MIKIAFVCHGNICRSPMAEYLFNDKIKKMNLADKFKAYSFATSSEEIGNGIYPPVKRILNSLNINCSDKRAMRLKSDMYDEYDYFIGMDNENIYNMERLFNNENKIYLLSYFKGINKEVDDPWYTSDFYSCYKEIDDYLNYLIEYLIR